jgi:hypothetical protein
VDFLLGDRPVFDATGNDQELAFLQPDVPIPERHVEAALHHQEQLVLVVVVVPDELALELDPLDLLAVQFADDRRISVVAKPRQLLAEVDLPYDASIFSTLFLQVVSHALEDTILAV